MTTFEELEAEQELAVIIADSRGLVTKVNSRFEKLFGWTSAEIVGRPLSMIIPPSLREAHQAGFSRFLMTNEPRLLGQAIRLKAIRKDGKVFNAEHFIVGARRGESWFFAASIRPVTPRSV